MLSRGYSQRTADRKRSARRNRKTERSKPRAPVEKVLEVVSYLLFRSRSEDCSYGRRLRRPRAGYDSCCSSLNQRQCVCFRGRRRNICSRGCRKRQKKTSLWLFAWHRLAPIQGKDPTKTSQPLAST